MTPDLPPTLKAAALATAARMERAGTKLERTPGGNIPWQLLLEIAGVIVGLIQIWIACGMPLAVRRPQSVAQKVRVWWALRGTMPHHPALLAAVRDAAYAEAAGMTDRDLTVLAGDARHWTPPEE